MSGEGIASWKFNSDGFAASCGEGGGGRDGPGRLRGRKPGRGRGPVQRGHRHLPLELRRRHGQKKHNAFLAPEDTVFTVEGWTSGGASWTRSARRAGTPWRRAANRPCGSGRATASPGRTAWAAICWCGRISAARWWTPATSSTWPTRCRCSCRTAARWNYYAAIGFSDLVAARRRLGGGDRRLWLHGLRQHRYAWRAASITTSPALRRRRP